MTIKDPISPGHSPNSPGLESPDEGSPARVPVPIAAGGSADTDESPPSRSVRRSRDEVDDCVLRGCVRQDESAFTEFVICYQHMVFAILSRRLGCGSHVEDLAQEVFWKAYARFPKFEIREGQPVSKWLGTIARNVANDEKRRRGIATIAVSDPEPSYAPSLSERAVALRRALAELPERFCEAFLLSALEGMSLREVASEMEIAASTARTLILEAESMLRRRLARMGVPG